MSKMCSSFVQGDAQHTMRGQTSLVFSDTSGIQAVHDISKCTRAGSGPQSCLSLYELVMSGSRGTSKACDQQGLGRRTV